MMKSVQNLVLFKLGWIACVLFAAAGMPALSLLAVAVVAGIHLARVAVPAKEAFLLLCAGLIGLAWESLVVSTGMLEYAGAQGSSWLAPAWIVAMWVLFGTTINHGLSWLKRHWLLAVSFGLIGGPMAFYGGSAMGAVQFTDTLLALLLLGAGWSVLLPVLCLLSDTLTDSEFLEPGTPGDRAVPRLRSVPVTSRRVAQHG